MADDSIPESERKFLHALDCNIPTQRHYAIEHFELTLDRLSDDYEIYLRTKLSISQNPMLYISLTMRKFGQFSAADYTPPSVTYEALETAGLTIYDIDLLVNEWQHFCIVVEDNQGRIVLKPKKRHRDGNSPKAIHLCNRVFPFAEKLIREQIENHEDADDITDCFNLLAGLFCRSYQWLTIQKTVAYLKEVIEFLTNGAIPVPASERKSQRVVYQPFKNFGYRLTDSSLLQQLYRLLNRQFDFIHPE